MATFKFITAVILFALTISPIDFPLASPATKILKIGGTGAALGGMKLLAKTFEKHHLGLKVKVLPSLGSGGGLKALAAGAIDIAVTTRLLKAKEKSSNIHLTPYSSTAIVFASSFNPAQTDLSYAWLTAAYSAGKPVWADGRRVRFVLRPESETDTRLMKTFIPGMDKALQHAHSVVGIPVAITDQDTADKLEMLPGSLGVIAYSLILSENRELHTFTLNGVIPDLDTIRSGDYPMVKTFYIATNEATEDRASEFIEFLKSAEATKILEQSGHVPHFGRALR